MLVQRKNVKQQNIKIDFNNLRRNLLVKSENSWWTYLFRWVLGPKTPRAPPLFGHWILKRVPCLYKLNNVWGKKSCVPDPESTRHGLGPGLAGSSDAAAALRRVAVSTLYAAGRVTTGLRSEALAARGNAIGRRRGGDGGHGRPAYRACDPPTHDARNLPPPRRWARVRARAIRTRV